VDTEDQVRAVLLDHLHIVAAAERDRVLVQQALALDHRVERLVDPRGAGLDLVVEVDARAVDDRGLLEHLLDPDVDLVLVELEAPVRKGLGARVMASPGARGQD